MDITNSGGFFDTYINKRYIVFNAKQKRTDLDCEIIKGLMEKYVDGRFVLNQKDIATVKKTKDSVIIELKNGKVIHQKKPQILKYERAIDKLDYRKFQIAIFMKNITSHYSGGRYWAWLLGHILAQDRNVQVTMITNENPPFGKSFKGFDDSRITVIEDKSSPHLHRMGEKIPKNAFDVVLGIPIEGGISAKHYGERWGVPVYNLIFESPNFVRAYRDGADGAESHWVDYKSCLYDVTGVINNTEIGVGFFNEWMRENGREWDEKKSKVLWNTINLPACDYVKEEELKDKNLYHIVFVGRAVGFKRTIHIIRALKMLKKRNFVFHMISGNAGGRIKELESEKGDNTEIRYYPKIDDYEKFKIIKRSNMMVFPSAFEGFGLPPLESMVCEKICVVYELEIFRLLYKDHLVYAKDNDNNDLAKCIEKYLDDSPEKRERIKKAKAYADGVASHDRLRKDFFDIIEQETKTEKKNNAQLHYLKNIKKYTFGMIVCNGDQFIYENLKHIYSMADEIIIIEGPVEVFSRIIGASVSTDHTMEKIRDFKCKHDKQNKVRIFSSKEMGRPWHDKIEMQNVLAEHTRGEIFIKQDVDEFYILDKLEKEIRRMLKDENKWMINYRSYHFWGDTNHIITGHNFNAKQTRVWRWDPNFRHIGTFNVLTNKKTGQRMTPSEANSIISEDILFHYSYVHNNTARGQVLNYYRDRKLGDFKDVHDAWKHKDNEHLSDKYKIEFIDLQHPIPDDLIRELDKKD